MFLPPPIWQKPQGEHKNDENYIGREHCSNDGASDGTDLLRVHWWHAPSTAENYPSRTNCAKLLLLLPPCTNMYHHVPSCCHHVPSRAQIVPPLPVPGATWMGKAYIQKAENAKIRVTILRNTMLTLLHKNFFFFTQIKTVYLITQWDLNGAKVYIWNCEEEWIQELGLTQMWVSFEIF